MEQYRSDTYGEAAAEHYDEMFPDQVLPTGDAAAAADALAAQVAAVGGGPALELGIGTGRVARGLTDRGVEVHGVDSSPAMLERLGAKPGGDRIQTALGDLADPPQAGPYGVVFVVFNTLFMLGDQEAQIRCVASAAERLAPGGRFVVEAFVPDVSRYDRGQRTDVTALDIDAARLLFSRHDAASQRIEGQHVLLSGAGARFVPFELRYIWPAELDLMARLAGMRLVTRTATWAGAAFDAEAGAHVSIYERPAD
jgi:SAM-dependent methyltransferase